MQIGPTGRRHSLSFVLVVGSAAKGSRTVALGASHRIHKHTRPLGRSAVGFAAVADAVDGDGVVGFPGEDAVIADAEPEESFKFSA